MLPLVKQKHFKLWRLSKHFFMLARFFNYCCFVKTTNRNVSYPPAA